MANQYHDETGKFCSKDQMSAAVDRLAASGNVDRALALSQELTAIQSHNEAEMRAQLNAFINSAPVAAVMEKRTLPTDVPLTDMHRYQLMDEVAEAYGRRPGNLIEIDDAVRKLDVKGLQAVLDNHGTPTSILHSVLQRRTPEEMRHMVLASGNPVAAVRYADMHGWPTGAGNLEFEELASQATGSFERSLFAKHTETAFGVSHVLQDPGTTGEALVGLANNPHISVSEAQEIISRGGEYVGDYARIRGALLNNPQVGATLHASLESESAILTSAKRPEYISPTDQNYVKSLAKLDAEMTRELAITADPTSTNGEVDKAERNQVRIERQRRNIVAEFNASDASRMRALEAQVAAGLGDDFYASSEAARTKLVDARGYLLQTADFNAIFR